ncbi:tetratricopeptide repeat protein [Aquisalimonas asiatica]|uniref:Putative PEP-CTERM system TPR-repeat lipoprotein n=1 Tax=Aquisalimonas asiatica TaxID=406100 RepID=A0A1H8U4I2_9GAMM|nr:tetratricopeptide repeat protein [Aquisalimonas asiatica]SEO97558.1 putative PEP-CTERM system TPR-repeat lipoprotein [Aquisalimonas asiatica]
MKTRRSVLTLQQTGVARRWKLAVGLSGALALAGCDAWFGASVDDHLRSGVDYYQAGDLNSAAIQFRNVLQEEPEHARARYYLGVTQLQLGELDRARRDLERARDLGYSERNVVPALQQVYAAMGEHRRVLDMEAVEGLDQTDIAHWHYLRGRAAMGENGREQAEAEFRLALRADPGLADARYGQVLLAEAGGDQQATQYWIQRTLAADDNHTGALRSQAILHLRQGRRGDAQDAFDRVIASGGNVQVTDFMRRGLLRLQDGDLDGAAEDASALRSMASEAPWGPYLEGLVQLRRGERRSAQTSMEQAISRTDGFAAPRLFLAAIHGEAGRLDQSEYQLDRYNTINGMDAASSLMRIAIAHGRGNEERAGQLIDRHLEEHPGDQRALAMRRALANGVQAGDGSFVRTALSGLQDDGGGEDIVPERDTGDGDHPRPSREEYDAVVSAINASNYGEALEKVEALAEAYPEDPEVFNLKGGVHIARGEGDAALDAFREVLQRDPENISAIRNIGQLFSQAGREDVTLAFYRQAHENSPGSLEILLELAGLEARRGNDARVEHLVNKAIEDHPEAVRPRMLKARHALFSDDPETALATLEPIEDAHGENPDFQRLRGEALLAAGRPDEAADTFERVRAMNGGGDGILVLHARALVQSERYDDAEQVTRQAIEDAPDAEEPRVLLMRLLSERGDHGAAEEAYQQMIDARGEDRAALREGARVARGAGDLDVAVARVERAHALEPDDSTARDLARAYRANGDGDAARDHLESWVADEGRANVSGATLHLLAQLRAEVDESGATELYEDLIAINPDDVVALNNLAWTLRESEPQRALRLAERAHELAPDAANVRHTLAMALVENGKVSDAITHLESLEGESEGDAPALTLDLAELYVRNDRADDARPLLQRLSETEFDGQERAREALESLP